MSDQGQQPAAGQQGGQTPQNPQGAQPAGQDPAAQQAQTTGGQPPAANPATVVPAGQTPPPAVPQTPVVPADPNARTGQLGKRDGHVFVIPEHPNTEFDEANFLALLEGSISLTFEEKQRVIEAIPRLSIEQINELISIFTEELQKFAELEKEFAGDVAKLKQEREKELETQQTKIEEESASGDDAAAAEELKRQMGL